MKSKYWILLCVLLIFSIISERSHAQTVANYGFSGYCFNYPTQFYSSSTSTYTILAYKWDLNNDGIFNDATGSTTQYTFLTADTFRVGLKVVSTNDSDIIYTTFIIQSIAPQFSINIDSQCFKNNNFVFTDASVITPSGTISYLWNFGEGTPSNLKNPSHSYNLQDKTYSVKLIATTDQGCKDSITKTVTIHPFPQVSFTTPDTIKCLNDVFTFSNTSSISKGTLQYLWDFGDGNQTNSVNALHPYSSYGTYTVKLKATSQKGCIDSFKIKAHVDTTLYVSFTVNKDSQCFKGNSFVFTNTSSYCGTIDSTVWDLNGDGIFKDAKGNTINHSYTTAGNSIVGMIVYNGKQRDTAYNKVTVYPSPIAGFSINATPQSFLGNYFIFTDNSTITPTSTLKYNWYFGNGDTSINKNPGYTYPSSGVYKVKHVVTSNKGCIDSISKTATVLPPLVVDFAADTICGVDSTTFTNKSTSTDPILKVKWDFNNDNIFTDASGNIVKHLFATPGTYPVGLQIVTTTDSAKIVKQVVVYPKPKAGFSVNTVNQPLAGNNFIFTNSTTITPTRTLSYLWDFKDSKTSIQTNPAHSYSAIGSYYVKLTTTSSDGCKDTISHNVNVLANISLSADFTADSVCSSLFTTLTNSSTSYYPLIQINWDLNKDGLFDNGTGSVLKNKFQPGTHSVGLQVITAYDTSVIYKNIIVYPSPNSNFIINRATQPLKGNNFIFTNATLINPYSELTFDWAYGDGWTSVAIDGSHSYTALGTYDVRLIAITDKGCRDTVTKQVKLVTSSLNVNFSNNKTCIGDSTDFKNLTTVTNDSIITYIWDFDDGSPLSLKENPKHFYANTGKYDVSLFVVLVSGNKDTFTQSVTVNSIPIITINASPDTLIYAGQKATLSISGPYDSILWSTGTKTSSIDVSLEGTYSVNVIDINGCKGSESINIFVLPKKAIDVVTGFSPNGDGINDYWKILNIEAFGKCKVSIYNRWGDLIYSTNDYKNDWDGKHKGKVLPQGTYYYMIETPNDGSYTGPVNIVK
jgi:gliding motility-associated-like protein